MDELKKVWGELERKTLDFHEPTEKEITANVHSRSIGVIDKLTRKVKVKMFYALFFLIVLAVAIPFVFPLASQVLLSIIMIAYLVGTILLYQEWKLLKSGIDMTRDLKVILKVYHKRIKKVIFYEEVVGLTLYPISAAGGFFLGMQLYDRSAQIMDRQIEWAILIISVIVLTVIGHLVTKWLNKRTFGMYLTKLEENIRELAEENGS